MGARDAVLLGGPRDGFEDRVLPPCPELITVEYCQDCRREHTVEVAGTLAVDTPLYLRTVNDAMSPGTDVVTYRYLEDLLDTELNALTALQPA